MILAKAYALSMRNIRQMNPPVRIDLGVWTPDNRRAVRLVQASHPRAIVQHFRDQLAAGDEKLM